MKCAWPNPACEAVPTKTIGLLRYCPAHAATVHAQRIQIIDEYERHHHEGQRCSICRRPSALDPCSTCLFA